MGWARFTRYKRVGNEERCYPFTWTICLKIVELPVTGDANRDLYQYDQ